MFNNRSTNGTISLRRQGGDPYPDIRCGQEVVIQGGTWEAVVRTGSGRSGRETPVTNMRINPGGVSTFPIMIQ
jgi:hypothetical protein